MDSLLRVCRGLVPGIKLGDIVVPDSIVDSHGQALVIDVGFPPIPIAESTSGGS